VGTIIGSKNTKDVGEHEECWEKENWRPFHGSITLTED